MILPPIKANKQQPSVLSNSFDTYTVSNLPKLRSKQIPYPIFLNETGTWLIGGENVAFLRVLSCLLK